MWEIFRFFCLQLHLPFLLRFLAEAFRDCNASITLLLNSRWECRNINTLNLFQTHSIGFLLLLGLSRSPCELTAHLQKCFAPCRHISHPTNLYIFPLLDSVASFPPAQNSPRAIEHTMLLAFVCKTLSLTLWGAKQPAGSFKHN